jgi:hypothetical protein
MTEAQRSMHDLEEHAEKQTLESDGCVKLRLNCSMHIHCQR